MGNRAAQPARKPTSRPVKNSGGVNQKINDAELTDFEKELNNDLDHDLEVEKIKARENKNGK